MKTLVEQLSTYKSVHLNKKNIQTHFVGIPLIIWSVALLLTSVGFDIETANVVININLVVVIAVVILAYYFLLSLPLALMALILFGPIIYSSLSLAEHEYKMVIAIVTFIFGWVLQFVGHGFEKAKPAFVDDLNQLSIGPLFLLAELYFYFGLNKSLEQEVKTLALEKRKAFEQAKNN